MLKSTGLDQFSKELGDASRALSALDGTITTLEFDPSDSASVHAAIRQIESAIDSKVSRYRSNPLVADLVRQMKAKYRAEIERRARTGR